MSEPDEPKMSKKKKKRRGKKGRRGDSDEEDSVVRPMVSIGEGEMPEGAALSSEDEKDKKKKKQLKESVPRDAIMDALDQNLDM